MNCVFQHAFHCHVYYRSVRFISYKATMAKEKGGSNSFKSVDEKLVCDHSDERYRAVLVSYGTVGTAVRCKPVRSWMKP